MIQPNELRIGNRVNAFTRMPNNDKVLVYENAAIAVISREFICLELTPSKYLYNEIEPIPLTPDILEGSGFLHTSYLGGITQPKYLHQLQNLYFALTGEELKVNW